MISVSVRAEPEGTSVWPLDAQPGLGRRARWRWRRTGLPVGGGGGAGRGAGQAVFQGAGAGFVELRFLETAQGGGRGFTADLPRQHAVEEAEQRLDEFAAKWDGAYPTISQMWRRNWEHLTPFFAYPADIRKVIYTTNAVESLNMSLGKVIKTRGSFPNQEAAMKLLYLALEHIAKKWTMPVQNWKAALQRFAILLGDRVPKAELT